MPELVAGLIIGVILGTRGGLDPVGAFIVGGIVAVAAYMVSCWLFPYRTCRWCSGRDVVGDGRGNFRLRWTTCWWCRGQRPNRRLGARVMNRG
jgi:hypothetical protein